MRQLKQRVLGGIVTAIAIVSLPISVFAQTSSSSNYRVDQTFFGSGGELDASSANFRAKQTAGELTIGNVCSTSYCAWTGFNTTDDPFLEFVVTGSNIDLGYLNTGSPSTANGVFAVRSWQSGGYVVRTEANPPTNTSGGHQIAPLTGGGTSSPGTEQFGINLVANTAPVTFGADPVPNPNGSFPFGAAASNYATPGTFRYNKGDVVAQATTSSSITSYTVSYLFNISDVTPAGQYNFSHVLVATATY